jgi:L-lactate dehydrogenase complex protein LldG
VSHGRETVLARIRAALDDGEVAPDVPRDYRERGMESRDQVVALFEERVRETGAEVVRTDDPRGAVSAALLRHSAETAVVAPDLTADVRPLGPRIVEDDGLAPADLDALDSVVTTCAAACSDTGTIAFDGGKGQGRRAISLVPDLHVCVVGVDQIVETVPELFERLAPSAREGRPIVLVSGPSATSDIEFERVEGVHGPRRLVVVLVG